MATDLAWNLTDVAVLIAIGHGGFLRTMEALTLQRSQITARSSCVLLTLPIPKTGKRTGAPQSVIIDDLLLVSIINRLLCMLSPSDYLLQRSPHSQSVQFKKRWCDCPLDAFSKHGCDHWERLLVLSEDRTHPLKREHLRHTFPCRSQSNSLPMLTNWDKPCWTPFFENQSSMCRCLKLWGDCRRVTLVPRTHVKVMRWSMCLCVKFWQLLSRWYLLKDTRMCNGPCCKLHQLNLDP